jgi:lysophospholipase L1-like esterase
MRHAASTPSRTSLRWRLLALLGVCIALDLAAGAWLRSGTESLRPLPPFDALTNPTQRGWLERQRESSEQRLPGHTVEFDAELGWCNARSTRDGRTGYSYGTNGARGPREYAGGPVANRVRCATFGDSFTHGDGLRDEETWQHLLEQRRSDVEVANFGVGGYGIDQALLRYRRDGRAIAPQVVWIGLMLEDVGRHLNRYRPLYHPSSPSCVAKPRFVLDGAELRLVALPYASRPEFIGAVADGRVLEDLREDEGWPNRWPRWIRCSATLSLAAGFQFHRSVDARSLWTEAGEARELGFALLRAFAAEAHADGARGAGVILYPRRSELALALEGRGRWWSPVLDELARRQIPVLDLSDALAAAQRESAGAGIETWYQPDGHPSAAAQAVYADAVERWAIAAGWLTAR